MYALPFTSLPSMFHISVSCDAVLLVNKEEICFSLITLYVNSGCCNKVSLIEWLINNISQFLWSSGGWKYEIWWEPTFQLADGGLLTVISHNRENSMGGVSLIRALIPFLGAPPHNIIISQKPHPLTLSYWGLGLQHQNLGGDKTLQLISYCQTIINTSDSFPPDQLSCLLLFTHSHHYLGSGLSFLSCHYLRASYLIAPCLDGEGSFFKYNGIAHPCPLKVISSLPSI